MTGANWYPLQIMLPSYWSHENQSNDPCKPLFSPKVFNSFISKSSFPSAPAVWLPGPLVDKGGSEKEEWVTEMEAAGLLDGEKKFRSVMG